MLSTGSYAYRDTPLHRMQGSVKLVVFLVLVLLVVLLPRWWVYLPVVVATCVAARVARMTLAEFLMPLARLWMLLAVVFAMNFCFFDAQDAFVELGPFTPSVSGLVQGLHIAGNIALVMVWGNIFTVTTSSTQITAALEKLLKPLAVLHLPTRTMSLIISVALQFIPILLEESAAIREAQTARGASFESTSALERARSFVPLIVPLFVAAFRRADELSCAMEARGYRVQGANSPVPGHVSSKREDF